MGTRARIRPATTSLLGSWVVLGGLALACAKSPGQSPRPDNTAAAPTVVVAEATSAKSTAASPTASATAAQPGSVQACQGHDNCVLDADKSGCKKVDNADSGSLLGPVESAGEPYCICDEKNRCALRVFKSLSCSSYRECWYEKLGGRLVPTRPRSKRTKPFKPCHDGEIAGGCRNGQCVILAWDC